MSGQVKNSSQLCCCVAVLNGCLLLRQPSHQLVLACSLVMFNVLQGLNPTFVRVLLLRGRMQVMIRHCFWLPICCLMLLLCEQCS